MARRLSALALALLLAVSAANAQDFDCDGLEGIFPDPEDCRSFYQCVAGRPPFHNTCDETLLFSDAYLVCDYAENVDCNGRPIPGQSTVEPPVTTTSTTRDPAVTTQFPPETTTTTTTTTTSTSTTTTTSGSGMDHIQRFPEKGNKLISFKIITEILTITVI